MHLLYHGTVLYDFNLELIDECLTMPPRVPDYRASRDHRDFVTNLPLVAAAIVLTHYSKPGERMRLRKHLRLN